MGCEWKSPMTRPQPPREESLEYILDISAADTDHAAVERPVSPEMASVLQQGEEVAAAQQQKARARRDALERLREAAMRESLWGDVLILLGEYWDG